MKKVFVIVAVMAIVCFSSNVCKSAPPYWIKTYGTANNESGLFISTTNDGNYIAIATVNNDTDAQIIKLTENGQIIWNKTYGNDQGDIIHRIKQTSDGGYIAVGLEQQRVCPYYCYINSYGWILKLDSNGDSSWQTSYTINNNDRHILLKDMQETPNGGYLIFGDTNSYGAGSYDFYLIKINSNGNTQWQRTYGGLDADRAAVLVKTFDGGYIMIGNTRSYGEGASDLWILKLNTDGEDVYIAWQKTYGGPYDDDVISMQQTVDGGFIVAGNTNSYGAGGIDAWILKLDSVGEITWQKTYGEIYDDIATSIEQATDGGYIVSGYTNSFNNNFDAWLMKLDTNGFITWEKTIGGTGVDSVNFVKQTTDNSYLLIGTTNSFGTGGNDFWVSKINENGEIPECNYINSSSFVSSPTDTLKHSPAPSMFACPAGIYDPAIPLISLETYPFPICYSGGSSGGTDTDSDGIPDTQDNCLTVPNGPSLGTCTAGLRGTSCTSSEDCGTNGFCSMNQEDHFPPNGNGVGDACDCEGNFDCDGDVDGTDASKFKEDFGRSKLNNVCPSCPGVVTTTTSTVGP